MLKTQYNNRKRVRMSHAERKDECGWIIRGGKAAATAAKSADVALSSSGSSAGACNSIKKFHNDKSVSKQNTLGLLAS